MAGDEAFCTLYRYGAWCNVFQKASPKVSFCSGMAFEAVLFIRAFLRRNSRECRSGGGVCSLLDMAGDGAFKHRIGAEPGAIRLLVEGLPKVTLVRSILRAWSFH